MHFDKPAPCPYSPAPPGMGRSVTNATPASVMVVLTWPHMFRGR